jgi:hypothetical protein
VSRLRGTLALLFVSLATANIDDLPIGPMAIGVVGTPAIVALILLLCRPALKLDGPGFTSLTQGAIRFNTYIGIPLVIAFYGPESIAMGAVFIAFMVPFINDLREDDDRSAFELTNMEFGASLSFKVFEWLSIDYVFRAIKQPQLLDEFQIQNNLLLTASYAFFKPPKKK